MTTIRLPGPDGTVEDYALGTPVVHVKPTSPLRSRRAFAAAHVVADPLGGNSTGAPAAVDWDATLAFRRHLWSWGLPVADAMDTAQRGMGMGWEATRELIVRSCAEARSSGGEVACGAVTDQLDPGPASTETIVDAYLTQIDVIESSGGQAVMMASRNLAANQPDAAGYAEVYARVLAQVKRPVIVHWLGEMFDPALRGYWGSTDLDVATESFLAIIADNAPKIDGVKISLLDRSREIELRKRLPEGVRTYTGDDFDYPEMIGGDGTHYSDAFLGAFDVIAPAASTAIQALDRGDTEAFHATLAPTVPLARHVFGPPTYYYKTGAVFMAYLTGHQSHFTMVDGLQSARSVLHLSEQFRLADQAGLFPDPDQAAHRMATYLALAGITPR